MDHTESEQSYFARKLRAFQEADYPDSRIRYQRLIDWVEGKHNLTEDAVVIASTWERGLDCAGADNACLFFTELRSYLARTLDDLGRDPRPNLN